MGPGAACQTREQRRMSTMWDMRKLGGDGGVAGEVCCYPLSGCPSPSSPPLLHPCRTNVLHMCAPKGSSAPVSSASRPALCHADRKGVCQSSPGCLASSLGQTGQSASDPRNGTCLGRTKWGGTYRCCSSLDRSGAQRRAGGARVPGHGIKKAPVKVPAQALGRFRIDRYDGMALGRSCPAVLGK